MRVAVLMGGGSREHDISLKSGANISLALARTGRYEVYPVRIGREGCWRIMETPLATPHQLEEFFAEEKGGGAPPEVVAILLRQLGIHVVFPALHGPGGEDGTIQGFLETLSLPYVGSDQTGAVLSMDKLLSKALYQEAGLPVAPGVTLDRTSDPQIGLQWGLPVVLKAPCQGSSFGLLIPRDEEAYHDAFAHLVEVEGRVLVERFIKGRELTCGVLQLPGGALRALPPTEIVPKISSYFDFAAKYEVGGSDEITPARVSSETTKQVQEMALSAHNALRMRGLSRTDFLLAGDELFLLETNALPGFTETSLFPQAALAAGYSFEELLHLLLEVALEPKSFAQRISGRVLTDQGISSE